MNKHQVHLKSLSIYIFFVYHLIQLTNTLVTSNASQPHFRITTYDIQSPLFLNIIANFVHVSIVFAQILAKIVSKNITDSVASSSSSTITVDNVKSVHVFPLVIRYSQSAN